MESLKKAERFLVTAYYIGVKRIFLHLLFHFKKMLPLGGVFNMSVSRDCDGRPKLKAPFAHSPLSMISDDVRKGAFTFLNDSRDSGMPPAWDMPAPDLWRYNLHYFQYLPLVQYAQRKELVENWIEKYTFEADRPGWTPYPTSLRLRNLVKYVWIECREDLDKDFAFKAVFLSSLAAQAGMLWRRREFHLGGNHYLENLITFQFLRLAIGGETFSKYGRTSEKEFIGELAEQVAGDGVYFELSPMYHSVAFHHLLDLWNITPATDNIAEPLRRALGKMTSALKSMWHPDGQIVLFNDAAFNIAPLPDELIRYAASLEIAEQAVEKGASGLYFHSAGKDFVAMDMAPVGPDYVPAHAHADFGTFELSFEGARIISDVGTGGYAGWDGRDYERSTSAHNTVEINGLDQCECWKIFRVARRYRPVNVEFKKTSDGFALSGGHDGYMRLPGRQTHDREFRWRDGGLLSVSDVVKGDGDLTVVSRLHFAPGAAVELNGNRFSASVGPVRCEGVFLGKGGLKKSQGYVASEFGKKNSAEVLEFEWATGERSVQFFLAKGALSSWPEIKGGQGV
ncbi:MAG: alginate lyase family protein [Nitrospinae bacterium]|nr:alginate lyase family protein [Nitrospinota bacterium]